MWNSTGKYRSNSLEYRATQTYQPTIVLWIDFNWLIVIITTVKTRGKIDEHS